MSTETKLTKNNFIPFLDTSRGAVAGTYSWARIDKSTIFALNANPQSQSVDYICYESPVEEIDHYEPELPQEIALYEGNPMYDFIFGLFYNLPIGSEVKVPALICFAGTGKKAWLVKECVIQLGELNTVDGKITFTLKMGGDITRGVYSVSEGVPTFSANITRVVYDVVTPVKTAAPQATHDGGTGYTAAISWSPTAETFAAATVYTATVTLTAASGYAFNADFSAANVANLPAVGDNGEASSITVTRVSASSATIVVAYKATAAAA